MAVTLKAMVQLHPWRESRKEWAPNMVQGMEESIVKAVPDSLQIIVYISNAPSKAISQEG